MFDHDLISKNKPIDTVTSPKGTTWNEYASNLPGKTSETYFLTSDGQNLIKKVDGKYEYTKYNPDGTVTVSKANTLDEAMGIAEGKPLPGKGISERRAPTAEELEERNFTDGLEGRSQNAGKETVPETEQDANFLAGLEGKKGGGGEYNLTDNGIIDPRLDGSYSIGNEQGIQVRIKLKKGWTAQQIEEARAKANALTDANTVRTVPKRGRTSAAEIYRKEYGPNSIPSGKDIDHIQDLQLGGADEISNMKPLNSSVNRSLGIQIQNAIKQYPLGTKFGKFTIE